MMINCLITKPITDGLNYSQLNVRYDNGRTLVVHKIDINLLKNELLTLLLSKLSEAVIPNAVDNHIGQGATLEDVIAHQDGVRFIINGTFNHYRKNFYNWPHEQFEVGDPAGFVKIRQHVYNLSYKPNGLLGFFVQKQKLGNWEIKRHFEVEAQDKYILSGVPLLISKGIECNIEESFDQKLPSPLITPPGHLGHAKEWHPRTAVAVDRVGQIVFVVVQDAQNYSEGPSLKELQEIGVALNFSEFLNLDGGGSSQFILRNDDGTRIKNNVSLEDQSRIIGNAIILFDEKLKTR